MVPEFAVVHGMAIDTLGYVKKLEAAGMDRQLAEAHAEAMNVQILPQLATSRDLQQLETRMSGEMQKLQISVATDFRQLKSDFENLMWKHTVATILTMVAVGGFLMRFVK